ncbi:MAG TPA: YidB family protein [Tabrizicola sp.]|nr:YidB family protein [Tabrizicola sp.]
MAKGSPSLIALLGLLAVAGYQNRDRLGEIMNSRSTGGADPNQSGMGEGGLFESFRNMLGGGSTLGGLSELFERFGAPHQRAKVDSWVQTGPNAPLAPRELEEALDEDTIAELVAKTGLSRDELLARLSTSLPEAIDQATPDGQFPPISMQEPRMM